MFARTYAGRHATNAIYHQSTPTTANLLASNVTTRGMADFTMAQLKELRALSGAPMMECKKALGEVKGDVQEAMDWLRKHGAAKASQKVSGRDAEEGLVSCTVSADRKSAAIVKISSETDFAGKSPAFVNFVTHVASATLQSGEAGSIEADNVLPLESDSKSVQLALEEAMIAIRENLGISSATKLVTEDGILVSYVHGRVNNSDAGSAAAIVELIGSADEETMIDAGKKLAMHIVAAKPSYLSPEDVPEEAVNKEKEVLESQIAGTNKPPEVMEKIVNGKLRKFYSEVCLTEQEHMVEEKTTVAKALKKLGLEVKRFESAFI
ncbi:unnamed protein product [Cylindrotheca closterium]|uniref:Elongation factor Ts, mitochondrial n=1 Tax=Cylindrotheca closterium TaxID=2856 RepID=A0AAD2GAT0_9STRA|nr:unnamed protein product [Cylindrotheca closterium]